MHITSERVILARHITPDGAIQLQQRPLLDGSSAFEIISNGVFLMASYNQVSERALARYALEAVMTTSCSELLRYTPTACAICDTALERGHIVIVQNQPFSTAKIPESCSPVNARTRPVLTGSLVKRRTAHRLELLPWGSWW